MFNPFKRKGNAAVTPSEPTPRAPLTPLEQIVQTREQEYQSILQRWIDNASRPDDGQRLEEICRDLGLNPNVARTDMEVIRKMQKLQPIADAREKNLEENQQTHKIYNAENERFVAFCKGERMRLGTLKASAERAKHKFLLSVDAQGQLNDLRDKYPRATGVIPPVGTVTLADPDAPNPFAAQDRELHLKLWEAGARANH